MKLKTKKHTTSNSDIISLLSWTPYLTRTECLLAVDTVRRDRLHDTQAVIADRLDIARPHVSTALSHLVELGLLTRTKEPEQVGVIYRVTEGLAQAPVNADEIAKGIVA